MDVIPTIFTGALVVLTIVLTVVGIQMVLVLMEVKRTMSKINELVETADEKIQSLISPLQKISGTLGSVTTGVKVFEAFVGWLHREKDDGKNSKK